MKIGSQHVYKIWRSLVEYRNCVVEVPSAAAAAAATCSDYLYAVVPASGDGGGAPVVVSPGGGCDAAVQLAGDTRLCDARPLGRARILLKDDHNYC